MGYLDLTHPVLEDMPVYPGTEPPEIIAANSIEVHGFREKKLTLYSHTGTHVDAPAHILADGKTLDAFAIDRFCGPAVVYVHKNDAKSIDVEQLQYLENGLRNADFLLLATGWDRFWGRKAYFDNFPTLTLEAASWLKQFELKGIGLDVISADPVDVPELPVHHQLLSADILIFENLKDLVRLPASSCTFTALPLNLAVADGAPVRAFAAF